MHQHCRRVPHLRQDEAHSQSLLSGHSTGPGSALHCQIHPGKRLLHTPPGYHIAVILARRGVGGRGVVIPWLSLSIIGLLCIQTMRSIACQYSCCNSCNYYKHSQMMTYMILSYSMGLLSLQCGRAPLNHAWKAISAKKFAPFRLLKVNKMQFWAVYAPRLSTKRSLRKSF